MTTISAVMVKDSASYEGKRLCTLHLRYPRFIHAELMTHRVFSRNARSSRAVPVKKMLEEIVNDPVIPMFWGKNQKGMQASEECDEKIRTYPGKVRASATREEAWLIARDNAVLAAQAFDEAGYHKQVVNRLVEPFMHIDTLVSATEWDNFFALRDHEAAEPHFQVLAQEIKRVMHESIPKKLSKFEWHLPYVTEEEKDLYREDVLIKLSVARCARISYAPFDGDSSIEKELERYDLLVGSHPMHASPAEHQAHPVGFGDRWHPSNLIGWNQYRKLLPGENQNGNS